jgi:formylglycine-generating enzyme required for sulfatase activity
VSITTYAKPELLATAPNRVWSWDITKLLGPAKWTYFYLYGMMRTTTTSSPASDPQGPGSGQSRVLRGGSWYFNATSLRSADRSLSGSPDLRGNFNGFRVVAVVRIP